MRHLGTTLLAAALATLAVPAFASPITTATQTVTFGPAVTDYDGANALSTGSFNLFDTTLGTLLAVNITTSYGFTSTITVTNFAQGASSGSVRTESAAEFGSTMSPINAVLDALVNTDGSATVGAQTLNPAAYDILGSAQNYSLTSGGTASGLASNGKTQTSGLITDSSAATLAAFSAAGGGTAPLDFITATSTLLSNSGGNTGATQVTTATGTFTISYTYDAAPAKSVPEPASLALFGIGLLGLGLVGRRKAR